MTASYSPQHKSNGKNGGLLKKTKSTSSWKILSKKWKMSDRFGTSYTQIFPSSQNQCCGLQKESSFIMKTSKVYFFLFPFFFFPFLILIATHDLKQEIIELTEILSLLRVHITISLPKKEDNLPVYMETCQTILEKISGCANGKLSFWKGKEKEEKSKRKGKKKKKRKTS